MRTATARGLVRQAIAPALAALLVATLVLAPIAYAAEARYHGNVDSKIYHQRSCRHFNCKHCTREFSTKEEAKKDGYRACKVCKP